MMYSIFSYSQMNEINQNVIKDNFRRSMDGTKIYVKWEDTPPEFLNSLNGVEGPFTKEQMQEIMITDGWMTPLEDY